MGIKYKSVVQGLENYVVRPVNTVKNISYQSFVKAEALRLADRFKESVKFYLMSIMADRKNYKAYLGLGIAYKAQSNLKKAIVNLEKARDLASLESQVHYELGLCYLLEKRFCEAIKCFHQSVAIDKTNLNAQLQLAVAHEFIEEYDMAMLIYHTIIEKNPEFITAYNHLSALYMNLGEFKSAGIVFTKALKINPDFHKAYLGLAICHDKIANNSRALHYYKAFLDRKPHSHHSERIKKRIEKLASNKIKFADSRQFAVV